MPSNTRRVPVVAVIEDQPDVRAIVKVLLGRAGFGVDHEFEAAEDALDRMPSTVDAIVLDHNLAGELTGLEAAPALKVRAPSAVIVLFSAMDLRTPAGAEPAIDAVVRKDRVTDLASVLASLVDPGGND